MTGRPRRAAMIAALAQLHDTEQLTDSPDHDDKATAYALYFLSGGTPDLPTVNQLAKHLTLHGCPISRPMLSNWLNGESGERGRARAEAYERVKREAAASLVDGALEVIEGAQAHEHSLAKARAGVRQWIAERLDRSAWGQQATQAPIVYGDLHLHALTQARASLPPVGMGALSAGSPPLVGSLGQEGEVGYLSPPKASPEIVMPRLESKEG